MKRQTIFGILGTLILGALGSGLWELIKPSFSFLGSTALTVISLGLDSVVNDIYTRVGRADLASVWIKGATLMILGISTYVASVVIFVRGRSASNSPSFRRRSRLIALVLMLFAAYILVGGMRHAYVAKTRGYFEYLTRVATPYMTTNQQLVMDSKLALVKNRQDYESLVAELKLLLKSKRITVAEEE